MLLTSHHKKPPGGHFGFLAASILMLICFFAASMPVLAAKAQGKPNFIFILIDDMGYGDLSCYGGESGATPQIDSLANEGLRFSQFYVGAPICSPSRVAFTTGQHPAKWRITSYLAARRENSRRGMAQWLDINAPTLAKVLQKEGYATGHFGKWHMGGQRDVGDAPLITDYGFDESLTQFEGLGDRILPLLDAFDGEPPRKYSLGSDSLGRGTIQWMDRSKITGAFADRAIQFIRKAQAQGAPFYVNLWPDDVHSPFFPPKANRGDGSKRETYLGVVKAMDEQFAPLFKYLRETPSLLTNTVVFIASDNGPEPGAGSAGPFRGHKGTLYEGGMREPFIVWAPGFQKESARGKINRKTILTSVDLMPSIAHLAGIPLPRGTTDGEDLSASLLGKAEQTRSKPLFWIRPPDRPGNNGEKWPDLATRNGDWKLLMMQDGSGAQLYDLAKDPGETRNLAEDRPQLVRRMTRPLLDWLKSLPASKPAPETNNCNMDGPGSLGYFMNPIAEGADPWVLNHGTNYFAIQAEASRGVALFCSDRLTEMGRKHVIWQAPDDGPYSQEVWAPELHFLDGRWYVYVAASDGQNKNHRMWALRSEGGNPLGKYEVKGPLYTGDHPETGADNRWAIDGTILENHASRYHVWSGWEDTRDIQWLYIAPMKDPLTLGKRVRLCANDDFLWERVGEKADGRGLHEAPQVLQRGDRTFLVYSCSSSWQPTYKLGLLELKQGGDPLNPANWTKHPHPVFQSTERTFGVGHNCFVKSPDGKEDWIVYHAKMDREDGWRRAIFTQPFRWAQGFPDFGSPVAALTLMPLPSGEIPHPSRTGWSSRLAEARDLDGLNYFGHHQFMQFRDGRLQLGIPPANPINDYRSGEKMLISNRYWRDMTCSVRLNVLQGGRDAGLLFRCTLPGVGYDAHNGYFAGIIPNTRKVVLGSMDCESWREIALVDADIQAGRDYLLEVSANGPEIIVYLDGKEVLRQRDSQHTGGTVGLRVVDSHAAFADLSVR